MEPKNRWIVVGVIVAIGGLGFLYYESKKNAAASTNTAGELAVVDPNDTGNLSQDASEPETGFNAGDSGYNGLTAGVTPPTVITATSTPPVTGSAPLITASTSTVPYPNIPQAPITSNPGGAGKFVGTPGTSTQVSF
jgi:hypothetical protein